MVNHDSQILDRLVAIEVGLTSINELIAKSLDCRIAVRPPASRDEYLLLADRLEEENCEAAPSVVGMRSPNQAIKKQIASRKALTSLFGGDFMADPVWVMLLELLLARLNGERISVTSLCIASGAPQSTALRWITLMEERGLVSRRPDLVDRRRVYIELSPEGSAKVRQHLSQFS